MVSRDTRVQAGAILAYVALLVLWMLADDAAGSSTRLDAADLLFALVSLFLIFAGAHLYLAVRGEDGMVPVDARWRFVAVAFASIVLFVAGAILTDVEPVAGVAPHLPVFGALVVLLVGYLFYEAREGYRERRPT